MKTYQAVESRIDDVEYASTIIPFNLDVGRKMLNTPLDGSAPITAFDRKDVMMLHADIGDYVTSLDTRLNTLFSNDNSCLAKRLENMGHTPTTLSYFQLQQKMLSLTGNLNPEREKEMLSKLVDLIDR
eukprot:Tbor_TRINITY_DN3819_c0_g1::TRINITY_DN3819_c0_g1_i1::g.5551::m.5551